MELLVVQVESIIIIINIILRTDYRYERALAATNIINHYSASQHFTHICTRYICGYLILNVFYYRYQRTHQESLSSGDCYIPAYLKIETTRIIGVKELLQQDQGLLPTVTPEY